MLITLVAAAVVLGVLILVHELGHFWAAKACDVAAPRFSIGLGPKAVGFTRGETEYVISWFPLGGYVKLAGMGEDEVMELVEGKEDPEREPSPRDFSEKPLWVRTLILSAGILMNLAFAVLVFSAIAAFAGVAPPLPPQLAGVSEETVPEGSLALRDLPYGTYVTAVGERTVESWDQVDAALQTAGPGPLTLRFRDHPPVTVTVPASDSARADFVRSIRPIWGLEPTIRTVQDGPAQRAGMHEGDRVVALNGEPVASWAHFVELLERHPGDTVRVGVMREGQGLELAMVPEVQSRVVGGDTLRWGRIGVGITADPEGFLGLLGQRRERVGPLRALGHGVTETTRVLTLTGAFLGDLVTGQVSGREVGGPIMIGQLSGQAARLGLEPLFRLMAFLSVQLAILNALPIPVLDGGHLMFLTIEGVRGRPVSAEQRARWSQAGFLFLAALMLWVIVHDIVRIVG